MLIPKEVFTESWVYKDGVAEGLTEGLIAGQLKAKRDAVAKLPRGRFPSIGRPARLDQVSDLDILDRLFDRLLAAKIESAAQAALTKFRVS